MREVITPLQKKLVNAYMGGDIMSDIARRYGVSVPNVHHAVRTALRLSWLVTPPATPDKE